MFDYNREEERKIEKMNVKRVKKRFDLVYLFNGTSTPYGLLNAKTQFFCKGLVYLSNNISIPYGVNSDIFS